MLFFLYSTCTHLDLAPCCHPSTVCLSPRILAVEKEIRQLSTGRIVNLPRLKETTALQELEAIIRGVT